MRQNNHVLTLVTAKPDVAPGPVATGADIHDLAQTVHGKFVTVLHLGLGRFCSRACP